jgi:hypothetical protein
MRELVDADFPHAERIRVVLDEGYGGSWVTTV